MVISTPWPASVARSRRSRRLCLAAAAMVALLAGCGSSGHHAAPTTAPRPTVAPTTSSTVPGVQTTGPRTVLSPIGLHVRAGPSTSDRVVGTASQGVVLTVTGYSAEHGGWYRVKGSTVTGWITGDPTLSAPGEFVTYSSGRLAFHALYPAAWTATDVPPASVLFRPAGAAESIIVAAGPTLASVGHGRPGYGQVSSSTVVVCGVTSDLVTYRRAAGAAPPSAATLDRSWLVEVRLLLDAHHALAISGNLSDQGAQLQAYRNFIYSVAFPFPRCNA